MGWHASGLDWQRLFPEKENAGNEKKWDEKKRNENNEQTVKRNEWREMKRNENKEQKVKRNDNSKIEK